MSIATAAKIQLLAEAKDFKATAIKEIGDLTNKKVLGNRVLVAMFMRPEKIGNIIRPQSNIGEDAYQSKIALVLKMGPLAFAESDRVNFEAGDVAVGDYILYRASDGFPVDRNGVPCRILRDEQIMMRIDDPKGWF